VPSGLPGGIGRIAQRESTRLTSERSQVQILLRPPFDQYKRRPPGNRWPSWSQLWSQLWSHSVFHSRLSTCFAMLVTSSGGMCWYRVVMDICDQPMSSITARVGTPSTSSMVAAV
jgi:hypothetical protein